MMTGIEITTKLADPDSTLVKVFSAVGLTKLVSAIVHRYWLEITIDGELHKEKDPLVPHFVECAPGEHDLEVCLIGWEGANHLMNTAKGKVTVASDGVTLVDYIFKKGPMLPGRVNAELLTTGTRTSVK